MHRVPALAAALLALSACRVERTPDEYLNPRNPAQVERRDDENEIAARVARFTEALARGSETEAVQVVLPAPEAHVMGTGANDGRPRFGPLGLAAAIADLQLPQGAVGRTPDLRVEADGRGMAWFATHVEVLPVVGAGGEPQRLRVSGVFNEREGDWRLVEIHLSRAEAPLPAMLRPDSPRDSLPPSPPAGAAPPGAG
ncbi:MAG TPA: nuclear transport factor 2 family protein [Longimicrobium sp.]|nr:nuclear transport factor 2 family protein [Longimicrobium sp.]